VGTTIEPAPTLDIVIRSAQSRLSRGGHADARRDAEAIGCWAIGVPPLDVWTHRNKLVDELTCARFDHAIERRLRGEPIPYIIGRAFFRHIDVAVDARVLIPRPETEGLVELVLSAGNTSHDGGRTLLEVGVGSGCIILSLALEGHFARLVGTDLSSDALAVARANVAAARNGSLIELRHGPFYTPVPGETFDVIVANPPYVTPLEYVALHESVRCFEPEVALVSEPDGLAHVRELCTGALRHLRPGGLIALEIDCRRAPEVLTIARDAGLEGPRIENDLFGRSRYLLATMPRG
jgi:release factor glutamine methyltransferase